MKPLLTFLIAFFCYTKVDIEIWQKIFEADELWQYNYQYHHGWYYMFWGLVALGIVALLPDAKGAFLYTFTMLVTSFNGTEDLFYYWLNGRQLLEYDGGIHETYHWLEHSNWIWFHPVTAENLLASVIVQSVLLAALWFIVYDEKI